MRAPAVDKPFVAEPDITMVLDLEGVIEKVTLSRAICDEDVGQWIGRAWSDIVGDVCEGKVKQIVEDAARAGVSAFREINQPFPSGLELPFEYTAVRLDTKSRLVAVGRNLKAVAELQSRLVATQQLMERDYWRLREIENRYRRLFEDSTEPVLLVDVASLRVVDANPAAVRAFDLRTDRRGRIAEDDVLSLASGPERHALGAMFERVRDMGRTPGVIVHFGEAREAWLVRTSLSSVDAGSEFVLQFTPVGPRPDRDRAADPVPLDVLIERCPDAIVIVDTEGIVRVVNRAFLDLVGAGARGAVLGEPLSRWFAKRGADAAALLAGVERHGSVRSMPTVVSGEAGVERRVEISAAADSDTDPRLVCLTVRDVERRVPEMPVDLDEVLRRIAGRDRGATLRQVVKDATEALERHHIRMALAEARGNRTVAAGRLGLSRQSLYAKLDRLRRSADD